MACSNISNGWKTTLGWAAAVFALAAIFAAVGATTSSCSSTAVAGADGSAKRAATGTDLFDRSRIHEITVSFAQEDFETMIQEYQQSRTKTWITASATIDGQVYETVGLRLKGNSSLMRLGRNRAGLGPGNANIPGAPAAGALDDPDRQETRALEADPGGDSARTADSSAFSSPEQLPWLIDLNHNVPGQNYQGVAELVVRSNTTSTALNEVVALVLLAEAGLASQQATYVRFSANGSEPVLRLVVENPDDRWMAKNFEASGALYKAESTGDWSYRGEDPAAYEEVFDQEAGLDNADLGPLIDFLDFLNNSDDATFSTELFKRLDVEAFATYLAMEELIANNDDIDGPGNNSYLYYDTKTGMFTVVAWDHNLAFGAMGTGRGGNLPGVAPGREGEVGGLGQDPASQGDTSQGNADRLGDAAGAARETPRQGNQAFSRQVWGPGPNRGPNPLVERFLANPEWKRLYENQLARLRAELCASGRAQEILDGWVSLLKSQASDLIDPSAVEQEAARISHYFVSGSSER